MTCGCTLKSSQTMKITLAGNPTTGYSWTYKISDKSVLKDTTKSDNYTADKTEANIYGSGGTYEYSFKALKPGTTNIIFTYISTSEKAYQIVYKIKVNQNGQITIVSKTGTYSENKLPDPIIKD